MFQQLLLFLLFLSFYFVTVVTANSHHDKIASRILQQHYRQQQQQQQQQSQSKASSSSSSSSHDSNSGSSSSRIRWTIECSAQPLFACVHQKQQQQPQQTADMSVDDCRQQVLSQQATVESAIRSLYPRNYNKNIVFQSTHKLINALYVELPNDDNTDTDNVYLPTFQSNLTQQLPPNTIVRIYPSEDYQLGQQQPQQQQQKQQSSTTDVPSQQQQQEEETFSAPLQQIGVDRARRVYCATGKQIRVAILDSGIDYTHEKLGGAGTLTAFQNAYGTSVYDTRNTQRDTFFPTNRVVEGYDFVGDTMTLDMNYPNEAKPDNDPIDIDGHGTGVAHAILAVAPEVELIAVKVCLTLNDTCPDYALVQGLEYVLDPNQDGDTEDAVDIVNLSLGRKYTLAYYSVIAKAMEDVFQYNVLPVVAAGNQGNVPFILGGPSSSPNVISVGATTANAAAAIPNSIPSIMTTYSTRGPGGDIPTLLKPDIVAPGGPYGLAAAGTGTGYRSFQGTSFASPLVVGAAALLKQMCLTTTTTTQKCSPFAIRCLLQNSATRTVKYRLFGLERAPVSLMGSGELQVDAALAATFWTYSVQDNNPTISLGTINAASNVVITRTLKIMPLLNNRSTPPQPDDGGGGEGQGQGPTFIVPSFEFRHWLDEYSQAVDIHFQPAVIAIQKNDCSDDNDNNNNSDNNNHEIWLNVTFTIDATKAPHNRMAFSGRKSIDPSLLDYQEFDGWIVLKDVTSTISTKDSMDDDNDNDDKYEASIPFHMILRQAANVTLQTSRFETFVVEEEDDNNNNNNNNNKANNNTIPYRDYPIGLTNHGNDTAQIDIYELIYVSSDDPEMGRGSNNPPSDFRYIGYRTIPVANVSGCTNLVEVAINIWESKTTLATTFFMIYVDVDGDEDPEYVVYNAAYLYGTPQSECRLVNLRTNEEFCVGYPPDFTTSSGNAVIRMCADELSGVDDDDGIIQISVRTLSFPQGTFSEETPYLSISVQHNSSKFLSVPSYDVGPGEYLDNIRVTGTGLRSTTATTTAANGGGTWTTTTEDTSMGLLLFTNGYRDSFHTGAATRDTEALVITTMDRVLPQEVTPDIVTFPIPPTFNGPSCSTWGNLATECEATTTRRRLRLQSEEEVSLLSNVPEEISLISWDNTDYSSDPFQTDGGSNPLIYTCPEFTVPRAELATASPVVAPPTRSPTPIPTSRLKDDLSAANVDEDDAAAAILQLTSPMPSTAEPDLPIAGVTPANSTDPNDGNEVAEHSIGGTNDTSNSPRIRTQTSTATSFSNLYNMIATSWILCSFFAW